MKKKLSLVAFLMMLALSMQASTGLLRSAKAQVKTDGPRALPRGTSPASGPLGVIVELESEPVAAHQRLTQRVPRTRIDFEAPSARAYQAQLEGEHADFKARAALVLPNLTVRAELHKLVNAVSIEVSDGDLAAIAALPGVKRIEMVKELHALLSASVPLINAPALWNRLGGAGGAGQGMKIAILDTGIDITNPLFSDAGFTMPAGFPKTNNLSEALVNNKVIVAKSFLRPASDAQDQNGHGSNCAGIAAGSVTVSPLGTISGVAPMAYLGNYRVLGANGSGTTDLIAQGMEQAVSDGFDVLSMSFGASTVDTSPDITVTATEAAVAAGRIVVIAAGNDGPDVATIGSPGIAPSAITVGATSNAHVVGPVINVTGPSPVSSGLTSIGSTKGTGSMAVFDSGLGPLPYVEADAAGRACDGILAGSLNGRIGLIERGNCTFAAKINNAAAAGARAVIIFNRSASEDTPDSSGGGDNLFTMDATGTTIPSFFVIRSEGIALRDFVRANPGATVSIASFGAGSFTPDILADFSSRGPSITEGLKPDVTAPGVIIYSAAARTGNLNTGVVDPSGFLAISGTSQATPHVAGSAALLKQLNPGFTPEQIKSALVSSATTDVFATPDKTSKAGVLDAGGGRVDLARASSVSATFSPTSLSFGIRKLKKSDVDVSFDLKITSMLDGQNTFTISVQQLDPGDGVNVAPSAGSISLSRGQSNTLSIRNTAILGSQRRDYTGYVLVTAGGQTLRIPYWVRYVKKKF